MRPARTLRLRLLALPLLLSALGCSMPLFQKMCLFSEVEGVVTRGGEPVVGATVERSYDWALKEQTGGDRTTTDAAGAFRFPLIEASGGLGGALPHEPSVTQRITLRVDGQEYEGWLHLKDNYDVNGELGRPIRLRCSLETEPGQQGGYYGMCTLSD